MVRYLIIFVFIIISLLIPIKLLSAEILQVTSSSIVQIGDNNRNYKVNIACIDIESSKDQEAIEWLRIKLPRHSKVNFHPKGSKDGVLIAELIDIKTNQDIAKEMYEKGFGDYSC